MIWTSFQMGTSRDRLFLGKWLIKKKSFRIPIEGDLRNFLLQLVFFYSPVDREKRCTLRGRILNFPIFPAFYHEYLPNGGR